MQVVSFVINALETNCYVVSDSGQAIIVDPGSISQEVLDFVAKEDLKVKAIINTHGHADHIAGNAWFMEKTQAPLFIHELEANYLKDPALHLGPQIRQNIPTVKPDRLLGDGDEIDIGQKSLKVLHTPGHSPGGISLSAPGVVLSGDTLFQGSVGRWDFPGADEQALQRSLQRLAQLPPETVVYPGHGPSTTIGNERNTNPFLISQ